MTKQSIYIILILALSIFTETQSQWIKAYNPYNGYVSCLSYIDANLYAGSKGNVYVSSNNGKNWTTISLTDPNIDISCVAGDSNNIFAGTFGKGIYVSTDNGNGWGIANSGLTNLYVTSMAAKDSIVLAGTSGNGIFRSINDGKTWTLANNGITNDTITAMLIMDSVIIAGSSRGNTFQSNDNGLHWKLIPTTSSYSISSIKKKGNTIFAGSNGGGVSVSQDGGQHWSASNNGLYNTGVTALTISDSAVFASTMPSGVFRSMNNGELWIPMNNGLQDSLVTSVTMSDSNVFAGTERGGVYRSTDYGVNWTAMNTGLISINVNVFITHGEDVFAGTRGGGVLFSTDLGKSWTALNSGLTALNVVSLAIHDSTIYAATDYYWIFKSTDYGKNWTPTTRVQANSTALTMGDSILYVTTDINGVYRTTDQGSTWQNLGLSSDYLDPIAAKDSLVITGSSIYRGVFLSSDYGQDWTSLGSSYAYSFINVLGWCGNTMVAGIDNGIFLRGLQGGTWVPKGPRDCVYSIAIKDSLIMAGTYSGVYLSTDWGEQWVRIDSGLSGQIYALAIVGSELFAGDRNNNIWKRSLSEVVTEVKTLTSGVVSEFSLNQNYPNPFNPLTTIKFSIPFRGYTTLKIYDILGKEVKTIMGQELGPGVHSFNWDAKSNSSGVYFYRLQSGSLVATKKLLLIK
jgi:BNR/Asp-box repeat.